jgi:probable phosphoglycerate mutase
MQVQLWAKILHSSRWEGIIAADIGRARRTAQGINAVLQVPLFFEADLREQDWGAWTGKTLQQIKTEMPDVLKRQQKAGWSFCPPGGESRKDVLRRSLRVLAGYADRWPTGNLLIVTHEGVIKSLIYHLLKRRFLPEETPILKPDHLHWLRHDEPYGLFVEQINAFSINSESDSFPCLSPEYPGGKT